MGDTKLDLEAIKKKAYMFAGALALATFLMPVIGPSIRAALNLP